MVSDKRRCGTVVLPLLHWELCLFHQIFLCLHRASQVGSHPSIHPPTHPGQSGRQTGGQATGFYLVKPTQAELFSFPAFPFSLSPSSSDVSQVTGEKGERQHRQQVKAKCTCAHCRLPVAASSLSPPSLSTWHKLLP